MRRFHFEANIMFDAEDINDAFKKLSRHFASLDIDAENESELSQVGNMGIHKVEYCVNHTAKFETVNEVMKDPMYREIED